MIRSLQLAAICFALGALGGCGAVTGELDRTIEPDASLLCDGYTLFTKIQPSGRAMLVDMQGELVHAWATSGFPAQMMPGGSLLGSEGPYDNSRSRARLVQESWSGARDWVYSGWFQDDQGDSLARQHHDQQRRGNPVGYYAPGQTADPRGSTLVLAHSERNRPDISPHTLLDDVVYEVDWAGRQTGWVWAASDHIDQFGFSPVAREAIAAARAQDGLFDWLHVNSLARLGANRHWDAGDSRFHPDNLILSARRANLVFILAADTGDLVWRIGPDFADGPEASLSQFCGQHHAHLIPKGLPGEGNILVFDNGGPAGFGQNARGLTSVKYSRDYSRVVEFDPIRLEIVWQYGPAEGPEAFYSEHVSGAQRLPNGNTLITKGTYGEILEVTPEQEIVWRYWTHKASDTDLNYIYRAYRVPPEWLPNGLNPGGYPNWTERFGR
jgi:hypothetical protein